MSGSTDRLGTPRNAFRMIIFMTLTLGLTLLLQSTEASWAGVQHGPIKSGSVSSSVIARRTSADATARLRAGGSDPDSSYSPPSPSVGDHREVVSSLPDQEHFALPLAVRGTSN